MRTELAIALEVRKLAAIAPVIAPRPASITGVNEARVVKVSPGFPVFLK